MKNGIASGSGRSIDGFNLHESLTRLKHLFIKFGGHYHAAGCTLESRNIKILSNELEELAISLLKEEDLVPTITVDDCLRLKDITIETVSDMRALEPFGSGNPEPVFYSGNLEVLDSRVVGENHLKLKVREDNVVHDTIGFNLAGEHHTLQGSLINMVYTPEINRWSGTESVQLKMIDIAPGKGPSRLNADTINS